jgi:(2R)-3-sulfolactate dehydrogenase (NADP+)
MSERISLAALTDLAVAVLERAGTNPDAARATAEALVAADADGLASHGVSRLPAYADQVASGKVDGHAYPAVERVGLAALRVDAGTGFAFPAVEAGIAEALGLVREAGVVTVAIGNSHHFGAAGYAVERIAEAGVIGLAFSNSPGAIAAWGGSKPLFGTNPVAFACPRINSQPPLVIDLSLSLVARGKVMVAAQKGEPIPEGWALDADGRPTTDAKAALAGTMLPMGGAKGAALVLMVELLTAALTGSNAGFEASSFFTAEGDAPRIGQLLVLIDPGPMSAGRFAERVETILTAMLAEDGVRLPGQRRLGIRAAARRDGVVIPSALLADLRKRAG